MVDVAAVRTIDVYRDQVAAVRARIVAFAAAMWAMLPDYRDAAIDQLVAALVPVVTAGQVQVAALTDAYLARVEAETLGVGASPVGVPAAVVASEATRGVAAADVYQRAGVTVWTALAGGDDLPVAAAKGLERVTALVSTDLQLAKTHSSRYILDSKPHVAGYRRVLEGGHSCALCIVASTQRYHKSQLLPIHPHCDCAVAPIYADSDPGHVIDEPLLEDVHAKIADRFGADAARPDARTAADYRHLIVVHEHGELGPVLAVRGQEFTGPHDI